MSLETTTCNPDSEQLKIAIAADIHIMAQPLLVQDGEAFELYMDRDRKMLKESTALVEELTRCVIKEAPSYLLVAGDLTKDGERISHQTLHDICFKPLIAAGIQPLVVPGNHDIANPHAVEFRGAQTQRVDTISADDFASIYGDCGYLGAVARDAASLSYTYQLSDGVRLLVIDACRYEDNDFDAEVCYHDGVVREQTLEFIETQLILAKDAGLRTIAMMHHGIVEHWDNQKKMLPGYLVNGDKRLAKLLRMGGVEVVFTGHSHAHDVSCRKGLYDVQTGSIVSYPCPYRTATIDDQMMVIESHRIDQIDFDLGGVSLEEFARENTANGFKYYLEQRFPDSIPSYVSSRAVNLIAEGITLHYAGDELFSDEYRSELKSLAKVIRQHSWMWSLFFKKVSKVLLSDRGVADNNLTIWFKRV